MRIVEVDDSGGMIRSRSLEALTDPGVYGSLQGIPGYGDPRGYPSQQHGGFPYQQPPGFTSPGFQGYPRTSPDSLPILSPLDQPSQRINVNQPVPSVFPEIPMPPPGFEQDQSAPRSAPQFQPQATPYSPQFQPQATPYSPQFQPQATPYSPQFGQTARPMQQQFQSPYMSTPQSQFMTPQPRFMGTPHPQVPPVASPASLSLAKPPPLPKAPPLPGLTPSLPGITPDINPMLSMWPSSELFVRETIKLKKRNRALGIGITVMGLLLISAIAALIYIVLNGGKELTAVKVETTRLKFQVTRIDIAYGSELQDPLNLNFVKTQKVFCDMIKKTYLHGLFQVVACSALKMEPGLGGVGLAATLDISVVTSPNRGSGGTYEDVATTLVAKSDADPSTKRIESGSMTTLPPVIGGGSTASFTTLPPSISITIISILLYRVFGDMLLG